MVYSISIDLFLYGLELALEGKGMSGFSMKPTIPPEKSDIFSSSHSSNPGQYSKYISQAKKITIDSRTYYLFVRNRKDLDGGYTEISSLEFGYVDGNKSFVSLVKRHFIDLIDNDNFISENIMIRVMQKGIGKFADNIYNLYKNGKLQY